MSTNRNRTGFDSSRIQAAFRRLESRANQTAILREIGGALIESTERAFDAESNPTTGEAWASLSEAYKAWRIKTGQDGKMLQLSGGSGLAGSIVSQPEGEGVHVGSNKVYAPVHQLGSQDGTTPARGYLGIDDIAEQAIIAIINRYNGDALS